MVTLKKTHGGATMGNRRKMPHTGHEEHLCFLENIGYLRSQELLELGIDAKEYYKGLVKGAKFICRKCGRAAANDQNLCEPEKL
jgi:hypothetical protein